MGLALSMCGGLLPYFAHVWVAPDALRSQHTGQLLSHCPEGLALLRGFDATCLPPGAHPVFLHRARGQRDKTSRDPHGIGLWWLYATNTSCVGFSPDERQEWHGGQAGLLALQACGFRMGTRRQASFWRIRLPAEPLSHSPLSGK